MQSKAKTVKEYLDSLPEDRRAALQAVREVILKNLDKDYEEGMQYGAISYYVPHRIFPPGYHCDPKLPLPFGGLGWQKHHMSVGLMCHYGNDAETSWFQTAWKKTGKKLDMGKCCVRFKNIEDAALDVLGEAVRRIPAAKFVEFYSRWDPRTAAGAAKRDVRRTAAKSPAKAKKKGATNSARSAKSAKKSPKVAKAAKKRAKR